MIIDTGSLEENVPEGASSGLGFVARPEQSQLLESLLPFLLLPSRVVLRGETRSWILGSGFRAPGFEFRILGHRLWVADTDRSLIGVCLEAGFRVPGFGNRVPGFGFGDWRSGLRASRSRFQVAGCGWRDAGSALGIRVWDFGFRV